MPPGFATILIPTPIRDGPCDDEISVELDGVRVEGDGDGNFLFDPQRQASEFDAVHTFAVVRHVVTTYKRILWQQGRDFAWRRHGPLRVHPYAGEGQTGQYIRDSGSLHFHSFVATEGRFKGQRIYTCRSFDIVAHETGHAILDVVNPNLQEASQEDACALREVFADLATIFSVLAQMHECQRVLVETRGQIECCGTLSQLGEQVGQSRSSPLHGARCLARGGTTGGTDGPHGRSLTLSRAIYDILCSAWRTELADDPYHPPSEMLYKVAGELAAVVVQAYLDFRARPTLEEMARQIVASEPNARRRRLMVAEFEHCNLLD